MEIGFIDYSREERNRILSTLKLLEEGGAVDELGIGTLRDAYADILFPGISTLQTRAKYFVLIPYLFQLAARRADEGKLRSGRELLQWLHDAEDRLTGTLMDNNTTQATGIIGSRARQNKRSVKMKPSVIYWSGLRALGILRDGRMSLPGVCAATVQLANRRRELCLEQGEDSYDDPTANHMGTTLFLPIQPPDRWEKECRIELTAGEAAFLESCIRRSPVTRDSLLAFLVRERMLSERFEDIPAQQLPPRLQRDYLLALGFSRFIYGAHVRYNVIYSNGTDLSMVEEFTAWREQFLQQPCDLEAILDRVGCNAGLRTFCLHFLDTVQRGDLPAMDRLIVARERQVKADRAKLCKPEEHRYNADSPVHFYHLDFRFNRANQIVRDILSGLEEKRDV